MPAMSPLTTFTDGVLVNAAALNNLSVNVGSLCQQATAKTPAAAASTKPILKLAQASAQSVPNNTVTVIPWDTKLVDTDNMFTSGSTFTITTAGWYDVHLQVVWANGVSGQRSGLIFVNGTAQPGNVAAQKDEYPAVSSSIHHQTRLYDRFAAGTVIRGGYYQNTGGALSTATMHGGVWMTCVYDAPY